MLELGISGGVGGVVDPYAVDHDENIFRMHTAHRETAGLSRTAVLTDLDIGLAFQVVDDILDEVGDQDILGKDVGSDRELDKLTFVSLFGLDEARRKLLNLHREALLQIEPLGAKGAELKALADYIVERDR